MRTRVYIASAISRGNLQDNIDKARDSARALINAGYAPLCPQLSVFMGGNTPTVCGGGIPHETWLASDLPWVAVSDAVLRLPGESAGADREVQYARELGIPVFTSLADLMARLYVETHAGFSVSIKDGGRHTLVVEREVGVSPQKHWPKLIAFAGFAGCGKDEAAKALIARGYNRHNFGDIIKRQIDDHVQHHFGFSAFTEDRGQKAKIRPLLETWGEVNCDQIFNEYFKTLPEYAVNTRLVRVSEAKEWSRRGGVIIGVARSGCEAATPWEVDRWNELVDGRCIDRVIHNNGTPAELHANLAVALDKLAK